jgi:hypothetical protein
MGIALATHVDGNVPWLQQCNILCGGILHSSIRVTRQRPAHCMTAKCIQDDCQIHELVNQTDVR